MQIRKSHDEDLDRLVEIWLKGSIRAHHFISPDYWHSKKREMKEKYLPMSDTYVLEAEEKIVGFVSMVEDYMAALFVDPEEQKKGGGKRLVEYVKGNHQQIQLKVYQQNEDAVNFYLKNDWLIEEESLDSETAEKEYIMVWRK